MKMRKLTNQYFRGWISEESIGTQTGCEIWKIMAISHEMNEEELIVFRIQKKNRNDAVTEIEKMLQEKYGDK
jgi:hypothetical protein